MGYNVFFVFVFAEASLKFILSPCVVAFTGICSYRPRFICIFIENVHNKVHLYPTLPTVCSFLTVLLLLLVHTKGIQM